MEKNFAGMPVTFDFDRPEYRRNSPLDPSFLVVYEQVGEDTVGAWVTDSYESSGRVFPLGSMKIEGSARETAASLLERKLDDDNIAALGFGRPIAFHDLNGAGYSVYDKSGEHRYDSEEPPRLMGEILTKQDIRDTQEAYRRLEDKHCTDPSATTTYALSSRWGPQLVE